MRKLLKGGNALLPKDIRIQNISVTNDDFHPILSSTAKLYRYRIWRLPAMSPFSSGYVWMVLGLNIESMEKASKVLIGNHNFKSFCATDTGAKTFDRRLVDIKFQVFDQWMDIYVLGEGFLKQMVRNIVGTLADVGLGKIEESDVSNILAAEDRTKAGRTAPGAGLSLVKVYFNQFPAEI